MSRLRFCDESGQLRLDWLIQAAALPVYGLHDHPLGLVLQAAGFSGVAHGPSMFTVRAVGLSFGYPGTGSSQQAFVVESAVSEQLQWSSADWTAIPAGRPLFDEDGKPFERYADAGAARTGGPGNAHLLIDSLAIAGVSFRAKLRYWTRPQPEWQFTLRSADQGIMGSAAGLARRDLLNLLEGMIMINTRADLIARYQEEFEQWE